MMKGVFSIVTCLFILVGCGSNPPDSGNTQSYDGPKEMEEEVIDYEEVALTDSLVPKATADNWKDGWSVFLAQARGQAQVNIGPGTWRTFEFEQSKIEALRDSLVVGLRVYFGMPAAGQLDTLHVFLVGVDAAGNDRYVHTDKSILKNGDNKGVWRYKSQAETQVQHWYDYTNNMPSTFVRAYAYTFNWSYVEEELAKGDGGKVFFAPALRTVYMPSTAGYQQPDLSANGCDDNLMGFQVVDIIMEGSNNAATGNCGEVVNFANPCPIYCGQQNLLPSTAK